jgi:hypothetical protein
MVFIFYAITFLFAKHDYHITPKIGKERSIWSLPCLFLYAFIMIGALGIFECNALPKHVISSTLHFATIEFVSFGFDAGNKC